MNSAHMCMRNKHEYMMPKQQSWLVNGSSLAEDGNKSWLTNGSTLVDKATILVDKRIQFGCQTDQTGYINEQIWLKDWSRVAKKATSLVNE